MCPDRSEGFAAPPLPEGPEGRQAVSIGRAPAVTDIPSRGGCGGRRRNGRDTGGDRV